MHGPDVIKWSQHLPGSWIRLADYRKLPCNSVRACRSREWYRRGIVMKKTYTKPAVTKAEVTLQMVTAQVLPPITGPNIIT